MNIHEFLAMHSNYILLDDPYTHNCRPTFICQFELSMPCTPCTDLLEDLQCSYDSGKEILIIYDSKLGAFHNQIMDWAAKNKVGQLYVALSY